MIYNIDVKGLEAVCAAYLSKDVTMYQELNDMIDMHTENQKALGLPEGKEGRGIAKVFLFRIIYGGSIFHKDPNFMPVSTNRKFWDKKLELFFEKYYGLKKWHTYLLKTVTETGMLVAPTGRTYKFEYVRDYKGDLKLPDTQIKNWIVQGLGADIVSILRVDFYKRFKEADLPGLFINTVHDSIVLDLNTKKDEKIIDKTTEIVYNVFNDMPMNFERLFGVPFDLKVHCEIEVGSNMFDMVPARV